MANAPAPSQRIDKWLWFARFVKTRTLAGKLVEAGKVRVNSQRVTKASASVKTGDVVTAMIARHLWVVEVVHTGSRRGPAREAQDLYRVIETTRQPPVTGRRPSALAIESVPQREPGAGRPTKRERRLTDQLRGRYSEL